MSDKEIREQVQSLRELSGLYKNAGLRYGMELDLQKAADTIERLERERNEALDEVKEDDGIRRMLHRQVEEAATEERRAIMKRLSSPNMVTVAGKGGAMEWLKARDRA
jgi:Arc/MetJ-type ribon-helix-helix transcriptional regulator